MKTRLLPAWLALLPLPAFCAAPAATSDYYTDPVKTWVAEHSDGAFKQVNQVLCYLNQTQFSQFVNKGAYRAQVDSTRCNSNDDPTANSESGSSSGSNNPQYMDWVLNVMRASDNDPEQVYVWVRDQNDNHSMKILGQMTVVEAPSSTNKYGVFTLHYAGYPIINGALSGTAAFKGGFSAAKDGNGQPTVSMIDLSAFNQQQETRSGIMQRNSDGSGAAITQDIQGNQTDTFKVAFNGNAFLRQHNGDPSKCFARGQFNTASWSYGVYDDQGARVQLNSGFPIKASSGGKDYFGFVGYYGLWLPPEITLKNGDTVTRMGQSGDQGSYTLFKAGGRLTKITRKTVTLSSIAGIPLEWQMPASSLRYQIAWDNGASKFLKLRSMDQSAQTNGPPQWQDVAGTQYLSDSDLAQSFELNAWSQALGGMLHIALKQNVNGVQQAVTLNNSATANVMVESVVLPGETVPSALACLDSCPDASKLTTSSPFHQSPNPYSPQPVTYGFSDMLLSDNGAPVALATGQKLDSSLMGGLMSGPLFDPASLSKLACPWNPSQYCGFQAWQSLDTFYTWQLGEHDWNQLTLLKDGSGNFLKFDRPLSLKVVAPKNAPANLSGDTFFLQYAGAGQLMGIPGDCIDPSTNQPAACGPGMRWVPLFTLTNSYDSSGNQSGDLLLATDAAAAYLVKGLQVEQRMKLASDPNACSGLSFQALTLPDASQATGPQNMPDEPSVSGPPAVIAGEIQH